MGAIEHTTDIRLPASVLIYPSLIIYGQLGGWNLDESSIRIYSLLFSCRLGEQH
jgi:hypothetical protein